MSYFLLERLEQRNFNWEMTKPFKCIIRSSNLRLCKSSPLKDLDPSNLPKITLKFCIRAWGLTSLHLDALLLMETDIALHSRWGGEGGWSQPAPAALLPFCPVTATPAVPTRCLWASHASLMEQGYFKGCKQQTFANSACYTVLPWAIFLGSWQGWRLSHFPQVLLDPGEDVCRACNFAHFHSAWASLQLSVVEKSRKSCCWQNLLLCWDLAWGAQGCVLVRFASGNYLPLGALGGTKALCEC